MGHKQTSGYHKTRVLNKIRLFDRFQSKESELDRFEKLRSCAALIRRLAAPAWPKKSREPKGHIGCSV